MPSFRRALPAALLALTLSPVPAAADPGAWPASFRGAVASSAAPPLYAYDFTDRTVGDTVTVTRGRIDPSRPKGQRVTIFETTGDRDSLKRLDQRYERDADGNISCLRSFGGADRLVGERAGADGDRVYSFQPLPRPSAGSEEKQVYRRMTAEISVDESSGLVRSFTASLTAPVKPFIGVNLEAMDLSGECRPGPDGTPVLSSARTRMKGAAFGRSLSFDVIQTISNLTPVTPRPATNRN